MSPSPERFAAIVPIRSWTTGKSRLGLDDGERALLARAFALDVVEVLKESSDIAHVLVVTSDEDVRAAMDGVDVVPDRGRSLDDAVSQGCIAPWRAGGRGSSSCRPTFRASRLMRLSEVVRMSEGHEHAYCPDAEGDGTSIIVSRDPVGLVTSYGPGSAAAHRAAGLTTSGRGAGRGASGRGHHGPPARRGVPRSRSADGSRRRRDQGSGVTSTVSSSPWARASARSRCLSSPAATRLSEPAVI